MAKANKQNVKSPNVKPLKELYFLPDVKVREEKRTNGSTYIADVKLSKDCTLISKNISSKGELISLTIRIRSKKLTFCD